MKIHIKNWFSVYSKKFFFIGFLVNLKFDQILKNELDLKGKYILAFKKPKNLEITYLKKEKTAYKIINAGITDTLYSICFDFRNNTLDKHQFDLEADINTNGDLEIYLISEKEFNNLKEVISKKSPIKTERIFSTKISTDFEK